MTQNQYKAFSDFREDFKAQVAQWNSRVQGLAECQASTAKEGGVPQYPIETPVVYNTALDSITPEDEIRLIVIGDNPGKEEQLSKNQKYLVGLAGKIGEKFFREHPELGVDFRKNAIILNKTPVHSAKTAMLYKIAKANPAFAALIQESQVWMAQATAKLHNALCKEAQENGLYVPGLWLIGYGELKPKGIFSSYTETLKQKSQNWGKVKVYQHFSMNRFTIDLRDWQEKHPAQLQDALETLGEEHKNKIIGGQ